MPRISNTWIGYVTRSYQQIKDNVLTKFQNQVQEITDHTESNPFVRMIDIWAGLTEMIGYYVDNAARSFFLTETTLFANAVKLASYLDYRIKGAVDASVALTFYLNAPATSDILIPAGTEVQTVEGTPFFTLASATIATGQTEVIAQARQRVLVSNENIGVSDGTINQRLVIGPNVVDSTVQLKVNTTSWLFKDTLAYSFYNDEHFTTSVNEDADVYAEFGDGFSGKIPVFGNNIIVTYYTTLGASGNVGEGTITEIVDTITVPNGLILNATNINRAAGGADSEGLEEIRIKAPLSLRTMNRAVTREDYVRIALQSNGVAKAAVYFECGKTVDVYIAPNGGGTASGTLLNTVLDYFEDKRMITTIVRVLPAGEIRVAFEISLKVKKNFVNADVVAAVKTNLALFMNVPQQDIKGTVELGDIYEVVETTDGVASSSIVKMTPVPFATPFIGTTHALLWERELLEDSIEQRWRLKMIGGDKFQLFKGSTFVGTFDIGTQYIVPGLKFKVLASTYSLSDTWTFYSYKYYGSFELKEFSVPLSYAENMTVYASGGI